MRDYGKIYFSFWTSLDTASLSNEAKLLAAYLLTSPHTNMIGCFRLPIPYVCADLGYSFETVVKGFAELSLNGFATYDEQHQWIIIHSFLKWNRIENYNQGKAAIKLAEQIPLRSMLNSAMAQSFETFGSYLPESFSKRFRNRFERVGEQFTNGFETVSKGFREGFETVRTAVGEPFRNQEQEQEQDLLESNLSKANTSVKKNSASPTEGVPENASPLPTLSAPGGAVLVEEDVLFGECGQREPTGSTPPLDGNIPDGSLTEAGTPGMESIGDSHHLDVYPEASTDSLFPASVSGDHAKGVTPSSQDALSSSKPLDQIAIEGLSPCYPHSTTPLEPEASKTQFIDQFHPEQAESDQEEDPAGSSSPTIPEGEVTDQPSAELEPADEGPASGAKPKPLFYLTKRKRKLSGWKLEAFDEFMTAFALKKGRAEAADAWLEIPGLTPELAARIIEAAKQEAKARPALIAKNLTPKMAQGWLSGRRWEDWDVGETTEGNHGKESQCGQNEEYQQSIRDALERFM